MLKSWDPVREVCSPPRAVGGSLLLGEGHSLLGPGGAPTSLSVLLSQASTGRSPAGQPPALPWEHNTGPLFASLLTLYWPHLPPSP